MPPSTHTAEFYVIFDASLFGSHRSMVSKVRAQRLTKSKPSLGGGEVALKFSVEIPDSAFLRLIPDVALTIPDGYWTSQPITVHIPDPED